MQPAAPSPWPHPATTCAARAARRMRQRPPSAPSPPWHRRAVWGVLVLLVGLAFRTTVTVTAAGEVSALRHVDTASRAEGLLRVAAATFGVHQTGYVPCSANPTLLRLLMARVVPPNHRQLSCYRSTTMSPRRILPASLCLVPLSFPCRGRGDGPVGHGHGRCPLHRFRSGCCGVRPARVRR